MEDTKSKKIKKVVIVLSICLIVLIVMGILFVFKDKLFTKDNNNSIDAKVEVPKSIYRLSGNDLEDFDLYFLKLENSQKNKVYSPLSIKYALFMLADGAKGNTKAQIDAIIGDYKPYAYSNNKNMSFANAMFIKNSYKKSILDSYTNLLKEKYNADIVYDSFKNPNNANKWVKEKTLNLLDNIFDDSISEYDFFLINALAIDMNWNNQLQCESTEAKVPCLEYRVFYGHENYSDYITYVYDESYKKIKFNGNDAKVTEIGASINKYDIINELGEDNIRSTVGKEFQEYIDNGGETCGMSYTEYMDLYIEKLNANYGRFDKSTDFYYYTDDEVKLFAKDLKTYDSKTLEYIAIMPTDKKLDSYIESLKAEDINSLIDKMKEVKYENFEDNYVTKIYGNIPLFDFEYELSLMDDLKKLGIKDVFDAEKADFSNLSKDKSVYIASAKHKANIIFSNDGIKASAATVMGGKGAAACGISFEHNYDVPVKEINLVFDNPYLFLIRDKDTGEIWFSGTVYEPIK